MDNSLQAIFAPEPGRNAYRLTPEDVEVLRREQHLWRNPGQSMTDRAGGALTGMSSEERMQRMIELFRGDQTMGHWLQRYIAPAPDAQPRPIRRYPVDNLPGTPRRFG